MDRLVTVMLGMLLAASVAGGESAPVSVPRDTWAERMVAIRRDAARGGSIDAAALCRSLWDEFAEMDWFLQDNPHRAPADEDWQFERDFGWYFDPARDAQAEQQMICRAIGELQDGGSGNAFSRQLEALVRTKTRADDPGWLQLYADVCRQRRRQRLAPLAARVPQFVFTRHYTLGGSHYAYTEGQSDAQAERHFVPGAALCLACWDGSAYRIEDLLDDPHGVIRDPDVSYDGRRVLFAWKKSDRQDDYHLYEMELATREIRQLTDGLGVADYEPCYLPGGDILFNSTRCVQIVDCWWTEVSNLYRCDAGGRFLRRMTFDQVHDNYPTVTGDGRILYTRWEYNDRGQIYPQPLLQMNPDGTNQGEFYGVNSWFPTTILHARNVPGTQQVLAIASGHHSRQTGKLILIDPARGRQENEGVQLLAPPRETPAVQIDAFGQRGELFQYPYPLSETDCLVTYHPVGWPWKQGDMGPRFGIYWMSADGRRERLVDDPRLPCSQAVPVRPRDAGRARPDLVDYRQRSGTCYVQDVYAGPGLSGVARGTIKTLRVVALDFRVVGIGSNRNRGPGGAALISTPIAVGNGAWDPKIVLGDAAVHEDGSAWFEVPARTAVYFQLLDHRGQMVQSMRSWTTLQPAENASCVGCHEHRNTTPIAGLPVTAALRTGPQRLRPLHDVDPSRGLSFREHIQPVLDRHCADCHNGRPGEPFGLTGRPIADPSAKRIWSEAYLALTHARRDEQLGDWRGDAEHPVVNWISAQSAPPLLPPYAAGSARSSLVQLLDQGHEGAVISHEERDKIAAWIDLGVPFCGDYVEANTWTDEEWGRYHYYLAKRKRWQAADAGNVAELLRHHEGKPLQMLRPQVVSAEPASFSE